MFTKHRPTLKVNFQSAIGEQDLKLEDLPEERKTEEIAFQEFVIDQHVQYNSTARLWYLPFILIQFSLTFLCFGILKIRHELVYKKWYIPIHFAICLILTAIMLGLMLSFDNILTTIFGGLLILLINYSTLTLLTRNARKSHT